MATITASEFKAKCLALLDQVAKTGEPLVVLKHGKPVARVVPAIDEKDVPQQGLRGTVRVLGDIVGPVLPPSDWEALKDEA